MQTASPAALTSGHPMTDRPGLIRRTGAWMDSHGRKAWITAMVLGFITVWPVGLGLLAFMLMTGRFSRHAYKGQSYQGDTQMFCRRSARSTFNTHFRSSGNSAFDAYKADTLKRLEDEQHAFESFLQRLREAKDKQEFDRFMDERASVATSEPKAEETPARGAY